jgi:hypothetical protein
MAMLEAAASRRVGRATYFGRWPVTIGEIEESFDLYVSPLAIDGESGQVVTMVDVTEVAEAESALRSSEALAAVRRAALRCMRLKTMSIRLGSRSRIYEPRSINTLDLVELGCASEQSCGRCYAVLREGSGISPVTLVSCLNQF